MAETDTTRRRSTSLGPHDIFLLDQWGRQLREAFGELPYLVGSVARAADGWRDVDLRMPLPADIENLSPLGVRVLNVAISLWGRQVTALPIDFQFQDADEWAKYGDEIRNPMGPRSSTKWGGQ